MIEHVYAALRGNRGNVITEELIDGICYGLSKKVPPQPVRAQPTPLWESIPPMEYHGYSFRAEPFGPTIPELAHLHRLHWQETEAYRHGLTLNMDYEGYVASEAAAQFVLFTIRRDGLLVGNFGAYLYRDRHTQVLAAKEDTYFITREHRKGFLAIRFGSYVEASLIPFGVRELHATVKNINRAGLVLEYNGYTPVATEYVKMVGEPHAEK